MLMMNTVSYSGKKSWNEKEDSQIQTQYFLGVSHILEMFKNAQSFLSETVGNRQYIVWILLSVKVAGRQKVNHTYKTMVGACAYS